MPDSGLSADDFDDAARKIQLLSDAQPAGWEATAGAIVWRLTQDVDDRTVVLAELAPRLGVDVGTVASWRRAYEKGTSSARPEDMPAEMWEDMMRSALGGAYAALRSYLEETHEPWCSEVALAGHRVVCACGRWYFDVDVETF